MAGSFKRLITNADGKTFLVPNNLRVHHARRVKAWPADQEAEIEVFYLPGYNPAPNPGECLNADVKDAVTRGMPACSKRQPGGAAIGHPSKLRKSPARVRKYFQHKPVRHAA